MSEKKSILQKPEIFNDKKKLAQLLLVPSFYLWLKDKKRKTGLNLTIALAIDAVIFLYILITQWSANFICLLGWVAVNVYCWLEIAFNRKKDDM